MNAWNLKPEYNPFFIGAENLHGLSRGILKSIALVENPKLDPSVTGADGEIGIMQIMPATAKKHGLNTNPLGLTSPDSLFSFWEKPADLTVPYLRDPKNNIYMAGKILSDNIKSMGGDLRRAVILYNGHKGQPTAGGQEYLNRVASYFKALGGPDISWPKFDTGPLPLYLAAAIVAAVLLAGRRKRRQGPLATKRRRQLGTT